MFKTNCLVLFSSFLLKVWTAESTDILQGFDTFRYARLTLPTTLRPMYQYLVQVP